MSKELDIVKECCDIWNKLKDKTKMIDYLIESKKQITDLEAKLAESEEQIWALENQKLHAHNCLNKLKQQLAEKEREIKDLEKEVDDWCHKIMRQGTHHSLELSKAREKANQDKISFALEQLEKVKEHNDNLVCDDEDYYNYITAFIDNQIEELKKEILDGKTFNNTRKT